jgi:hypothetical protein
MSSTHQSEGHVLMPAAAIGSLALLLAVGLTLLRIIERANAWIAGLVSSGGVEAPTKSLPPPAIWAGAAIGAVGLSLAILAVPGNWRRLVLWISALAVIAGWAPVLVLASRQPEIAAPLVATFWAGLCAYVYASRHHMAVDGTN